MATTAYTTQPMKPYGGKGTQVAPPIMFPCDVSETIAEGDVLIVVAVTKDLEDSNVATDLIVGVAAAAETTGASVDRTSKGDQVPVWMATPGRFFCGNVVTAADTNETGVYTDDIMEKMGIVEADSAPNVCCLAQGGGAGDVAYVLRFLRQMSGADGPTGGVGVINPRALFFFLVDCTIFIT